MNQFSRFLTVGVINTALGYAVIFGCMYLLHLSPEGSNVAGYAVGLIASYLLNKNFTFRSNQRGSREKVRFLLVFGLAYATNFVVLLALVRAFHLNEGASQLVAGAAYIAISYLLNKYYVFRPIDDERLENSPSSLTPDSRAKYAGWADTKQAPAPLLWAIAAFSAFYAVFFSPVVFGGKEFPSDGQLAAFYSDFMLWSDVWAGGWPAAADLTQMMFSPLRHLFRHLPHGFNIFIVSAYVLASSFMFGYVFEITRSRLAGIVSGVAFGLSGFMMAHLGHTAMVSGAAWTPLLLWSFEKLRGGFRPHWFVAGVVAVCMMLFAGHPQITVYSCLLAGAYAFIASPSQPTERLRYLIMAAMLFAVGIGLTAVQWLPTHELSKWTFRNEFSYDEFSAFCLPAKQLLTLVFPFLFGSQYGLFFSRDYFGAGGYSELSGYAGISCLLLAAIALLARRDKRTMFWAIVAFVAVVLALGASLPWIAKITYRVPVISKFRVPARHLFEYCVAISILAGVGSAALQRSEVAVGAVRRLLIAATIAFPILCILALAIYAANTSSSNWPGTIALFSLKLPAAVLLPMLWMILSLIATFACTQTWLYKKAVYAIVPLVAIEMASFGWFQAWRLSGFGEHRVLQHEMVRHYDQLAKQSMQSIVSNTNTGIPPDNGRLSGIRTLNWYGPLMLRHYSEATGINTAGVLDSNSLALEHVGLDLYGARYLFIDPPPIKQVHGLSWHGESLDWRIGVGCGSAFPVARRFQLPAPVVADQLAIVTLASCSTGFANGDPVAEIVLHGADGQAEILPIIAGSDTAEWAADCSDVAPLMRHKKAAIFESWRNVRPDNSNCDAHSYVARKAFPLKAITSIELRTQNQVSLNLIHATLLNGRDGTVRPISPIEALLAPPRWHFLQTASGLAVYENSRALPSVRLLFETVPVTPEQALKAIRTSTLPDGSKFIPERQALVEDGIAIHNATDKSVARLLSHDGTRWEIETEADRSSLLVVGQNFYPGWQATVDGTPIHIVKVNYSQQGLRLPAGNHKVVLSFFSRSVAAGMAITSLSFVVLICLVWYARRKR